MRKLSRLFILVVLSIIILPLTNCHGKRKIDDFIAPESFDMTRNYELSFWSKNDTNIIQKKIYQNAIDEFEAIYPNIKINLRSMSNYEDIYKDVLTNIKTNTTPNICITYPDHVATYISGDNIVVPLDDLMDNSDYGFGSDNIRFDGVKKDEIYPKFLDECKYNGSYYSVPFMRSTEALYINKTAVEALGYTIPDVLSWDFVFDVCSKSLEGKTDNDVFYPFIYKSVDNQLISMLKQKNAPYSDSFGSIFIDNEKTRDILDEIAYHKAKREFEIFAVVSYPGNYFNAGKCIFAVDSTAGATWMGTKAPQQEIDESTIADFETIVRPIPQYDVNNPQMISQGPSVCIFNKEDPQEVVASWIFVQYLLTNNVQIPYSETEGYLPVTSKATTSADYLAYVNGKGKDNYDGFSDELISAKQFYSSDNKRQNAAAFFYDVKIDAEKLLVDNIDNTFITPVFNGSTALRNAAGYLIEMTIKEINKNSKVINGDNYKDVINEKFFDDLFAKTINKYKLNDIDRNIGYVITDKKLPMTSIILLLSIGIAWIVIIFFATRKYLKAKKVARDKKKI